MSKRKGDALLGHHSVAGRWALRSVGKLSKDTVASTPLLSYGDRKPFPGMTSSRQRDNIATTGP